MSLVDDYYKHCATCQKYDLLNKNNSNHIGFRCLEKGEIYPMDDGCSPGLFKGYSYNRRVNDKDIKDALKIIEENQKSGCYLTTIVSFILKHFDDCSYLETLRNFRDNVLQKDMVYAHLLYLYDTIGPIISYKLENEDNNHELANILLNYYIKYICYFIKIGNYELAIEDYIKMTKELQKRYNITEPSDIAEYKILDNTGHGYVREKNKV